MIVRYQYRKTIKLFQLHSEQESIPVGGVSSAFLIPLEGVLPNPPASRPPLQAYTPGCRLHPVDRPPSPVGRTPGCRLSWRQTSLWTEWHTLQKILPCLRLPLRTDGHNCKHHRPLADVNILQTIFTQLFKSCCSCVNIDNQIFPF